MNEVFLIGKVITEVEFKFIIHSRRISKVKFSIETITDSGIINVVAYDEIADYIYRNISITDILIVNGYVEGNNVIVKELAKILLY